MCDETEHATSNNSESNKAPNLEAIPWFQAPTAESGYSYEGMFREVEAEREQAGGGSVAPRTLISAYSHW